MVIVYKLAPVTYQVAKRVVSIEHVGLCNIVAGETIVKELLQDDASPEKISAEIGKILENEAYQATMRHKLATIQGMLGGGGASRNVAKLVEQLVR